MGWTVAPAVSAALREATSRWPDRNRASDGTIGDAAHSSRTSDHNPDSRGVVLAFDLTHDPAHGCDAHALVRAAVTRRDRRIKYAISNGRIWSLARAAEGWRAYSGSNQHTKHAHVSVRQEYEKDTSPWWATQPKPLPNTAPPFPLPEGHWFGRPHPDRRNHSGYFSASERQKLSVWQRRMRDRGWTINTDGRFTDQTRRVANAFAAQVGLPQNDKIAAPKWKRAWTAPITR